jgi:hypothetical protein
MRAATEDERMQRAAADEELLRIARRAAELQ